MVSNENITREINGREVWVDVLRAFACISVLLVHSPAKYDGQIPGQFVLAPANYLFMAWGVSVFFMISGALLFNRPQTLVPFYKKRFTRVLCPIVIWSVIYIIFDDYFIPNDLSYLQRILRIPLYEQSGIMWFMYTLVGIYLVTPIISVWLSSCTKRDVEIILGIWVITLLLPYLILIDPKSIAIIGANGTLHHFYGFIGYALLGYYLRKYVNILLRSWTFGLMCVCAFGFPLFVYFSNALPIDVLNDSMSLSSALMSTVAFLFFKGIDYKDGRLLRIILKIAEFSFGIYLCHMLFLLPLRYWLTQFHINYIIQIPLTALFVGIVSYLFVWILSKIPYSKLLFG